LPTSDFRAAASHEHGWAYKWAYKWADKSAPKRSDKGKSDKGKQVSVADASHPFGRSCSMTAGIGVLC
jgi:hypothetical protein